MKFPLTQRKACGMLSSSERSPCSSLTFNLSAPRVDLSHMRRRICRAVTRRLPLSILRRHRWRGDNDSPPLIRTLRHPGHRGISVPASTRVHSLGQVDAESTLDQLRGWRPIRVSVLEQLQQLAPLHLVLGEKGCAVVRV